MIMFLCIYLVIGLLIAVWSRTGIKFGEDMGKYDIIIFNLYYLLGTTLFWPLLIIMAFKIIKGIDK